MWSSRAKPALTLWASSYLGCVAFPVGELVARGELGSTALLAQLLWLALLASAPVSMAVAVAWRMASSRRALRLVSTVALALLGTLFAWDHSDFLLSGAHWAAHPQRTSYQLMVAASIGMFSGAGWSWLLWGYRTPRNGWSRPFWVVVSTLSVAGCVFVVIRYRAYDYSVAQIVLPACILCAAMLHGSNRERPGRPIVLVVAGICILFAVGAQFDESLTAVGEREAIAKSRIGALARLYLLPSLRRGDDLSSGGLDCPETRSVVNGELSWAGSDARRNVIVVTVDALREDVVGTAVGDRPVTPELSHWLNSATSFDNATTTYPATLFAIGSAFTGLSPAELYLFPGLPETIFTLSHAHIDRQIAVLPDVSWFKLPIVEEFLTRGVDVDFVATDGDATAALIERLRSARADDETVMAWVHYYSPHAPYRTHPGLEMGAGKKNAYLSEVAHFDRELGKLMRFLEEDGWLKDSLVVFFSDHGEALGERSYWGHHVYLDGWMIDVPLVLWHADLAPDTRSAGVGLADVAPTVLHFLGLPMPNDIGAESLFTLTPDDAERPSFTEAFPIRGRQLFDGFRLDELDDASIGDRLSQIRVANQGYEPKIAITQGPYRLIQHRAADASFLFERGAGSNEEGSGRRGDSERAAILEENLARWQREQLRRIRCRLNLQVDTPSSTDAE